METCAASVMSSVGIDEAKIRGQIDGDSECSKEKVFEELLLDRNRFSQLNYYPAIIMNREPVIVFLF